MGKKVFMAFVVLALLLTSCAGKTTDNSSSSTTPSDSAPATTSSDSPAANSAPSNDLGGALNLVMGSDSQPSVFDSYHIEVTMDTPKLSDDGSAIINETTQISADVQGKNIHIFQIDPGQTTQKEGYIIGDNEYKIVDGAPQEMMGQIGLSWAMWPLTVVLAYAYPAYFAQKTGTDTIDGQAADVYTFDSASTNAVSNTAMNAMGMGDSTQGKGTLWVDPKTGAMLKLDMTYTKSISDNNQKEIGTGSGSIKLEVSKINQVVVTSPK